VPALLAFADGTLFWGEAIGFHGITTGEVVFNTAMSGYQEVLTDPSYAGQMVMFTAPHIGNVGVNHADRESHRAWATGVIVRECSSIASNWRSEQSFSDWLIEQKLVGIAGIDTRQLTIYLRERGSQMACIMAKDPNATMAINLAQEVPLMLGRDLTAEVSTRKIYEWTEGSSMLIRQHAKEIPKSQANQKHLVVYDFGVKYAILRQLVDRGCRVTVVPALTPSKEVLALKPDAVVLSNGPGDPDACGQIIEEIRQLLSAELPILGICLGHQLLALALGAQTFKMKFGHHGINHPVKDLRNGRVQVTSQNHNFAVDETTLPPELQITHRSLFDDTVQGFRHTNKPVMSVQGHPEASPGPLDANNIFDEFLEAV
jgi:carbamoyl-phosphate synthase small subunit